MSGGNCCSEGRCFCIPIRPVHHQSLIVNTGPSDAPVALWANVGLLYRTILCRWCAIKTTLYRSEKAGVVDLQPVLELPPKQQEVCLVVDWGGGKICLEFWKHLEAEQPTFLAGNADGVKCNDCRQQRSIHVHLCSAIECLGRSTLVPLRWHPKRLKAALQRGSKDRKHSGRSIRRTMGISGNIPNQVKMMFPFIRKNLQ